MAIEAGGPGVFREGEGGRERDQHDKRYVAREDVENYPRPSPARERGELRAATAGAGRFLGRSVITLGRLAVVAILLVVLVA
jgi:hypothetical protein